MNLEADSMFWVSNFNFYDMFSFVYEP